MINFALKKGYTDKEIKTLAHHQALHRDIKLHYFIKPEDVPTDYIPVGYIDWVTNVLGLVPKPIDFPEFLYPYFKRKIWETDVWPLQKDIFIKPSDKPKRFEALLTTGTYKGKKKPPYYCSEKVTFINEWRNYVVNGKIMYTGWYKGIDDEAIQPYFNKDIIPKEWCGVIDMGITDKGEFLLVEANEPYSVGWYGTFIESKIYVDFLIKGWEYLNKYIKD